MSYFLLTLMLSRDRYIWTPQNPADFNAGWAERQIITGATGTNFGSGLAASGSSFLAISAPFYAAPGEPWTTGKVHIFAPATGDVAGAWVERFVFEAPAPANDPQGVCTTNYDLGRKGAVATHGTTVVVGAQGVCLDNAPSASKQQGAVFVLTPTANDLTAWNSEVISATVTQDFSSFGSAVSIAGREDGEATHIVVGAWRVEGGSTYHSALGELRAHALTSFSYRRGQLWGSVCLSKISSCDMATNPSLGARCPGRGRKVWTGRVCYNELRVHRFCEGSRCHVCAYTCIDDTGNPGRNFRGSSVRRLRRRE